MSSILSNILSTLYFFLPAIAGNITPVFVTRYNLLPQLNKPLDGNLLWRSQRLLGDNKTIRGLLSGIIVAALVGFWQGNLVLGATMGFGALWGDAIKSFFKRRFNKKPGSSWKPWDQIDFVIGATLITLPLSPQPITYYFIALVIIGFGSYVTSYLGVKTGLKKSL